MPDAGGDRRLCRDHDLHHLKIVDAAIGMRVEEKNEIIGLDLTQQSEAAYTVIE